MIKAYDFNIQGIVTKEEMEDFILEVNNCEFCNNGKFILNLKEFSYNENKDMGIGIIEVNYKEKIKIHDKLIEMIHCEFCHNDIDYISIMPID